MTYVGPLRPYARSLEASFNDLAEQLNGHYPSAPKQYEAPERITCQPVRLTRFADCPLCTLNVNQCDCPPDLYAAAVYAKQKEAEHGRS